MDTGNGHWLGKSLGAGIKAYKAIGLRADLHKTGTDFMEKSPRLDEMNPQCTAYWPHYVRTK